LWFDRLLQGRRDVSAAIEGPPPGLRQHSAKQGTQTEPKHPPPTGAAGDGAGPGQALRRLPPATGTGATGENTRYFRKNLCTGAARLPQDVFRGPHWTESSRLESLRALQNKQPLGLFGQPGGEHPFFGRHLPPITLGEGEPGGGGGGTPFLTPGGRVSFLGEGGTNFPTSKTEG